MDHDRLNSIFSKHRLVTLLCLLFQQFLLFLAASSALDVVISGRFADGVVRFHAFILADQIIYLLLAIFHTWAIILLVRHAE